MILLALIAISSKYGNRDFYEILGLKHDCTERDVEKSFMRLSRKYHPDKRKTSKEITDLFEDINDAYSVLRDSNKRRVYDLWGESGVRVYEAPKNDFAVNAHNSEDDLSKQVRVKGKTVRITFPVDLVDFHEGRVYPLTIKRRTMCRCPEAGFGCEKCRGRPTMKENVTLTLVVEKGSDEGSVVLFKNAGDVSEMNEAGDIEVVLVSRQHPLFERHGSDLHVNVSISLREALLGFRRELQHLDGSTLVIETSEGVGTGKPVVVKNRGLAKYLFPGEYGDVVVHTKIMWPKNLDPEKKAKLIEAL